MVYDTAFTVAALLQSNKGLPEDPANSPREASPDLMSVEEKLSESLKDIFQKKVVSDPLMKALLEILIDTLHFQALKNTFWQILLLFVLGDRLLQLPVQMAKL